jgi:hypothetical protein
MEEGIEELKRKEMKEGIDMEERREMEKMESLRREMEMMERKRAESLKNSTHTCPYGCGRQIPDKYNGCSELLQAEPNYFG